MPYIPQADRDLLNEAIAQLAASIRTAGEANYAITSLVHKLIRRKELCYHTLQDAIGLLECAKLELYRAVAAPYEDMKRAANGPVDLDKEV